MFDLVNVVIIVLLQAIQVAKYRFVRDMRERERERDFLDPYIEGVL